MSERLPKSAAIQTTASVNVLSARSAAVTTAGAGVLHINQRLETAVKCQQNVRGQAFVYVDGPVNQSNICRH